MSASKISDYARWAEYTNSYDGRWRIDQIHNGREGRDLLYFKGDMEEGSYFMILQDGTIAGGTYKDAYPHIGDAIFTEMGRKKHKDFNTAVMIMGSAMGMHSLLNRFA